MTTNGDEWGPPTRTMTEARRFDRLRQEVVSGGTERPRPPDADDDAIGGTWAGRLAALGIIGLFAWLAFVNGWMFLFAMGILVSVFLHETGHYVTARLTGMKATQFFLGFGPRLWSFRRGETEYGARLLPLGAFVKIIGMSRLDDVPPEDEGRTYRQQSYPRRMLVISAGSIMHMLIAVVLLFTVFSIRGDLVDVPGAQVGGLTQGGAAATAGVEEGDRIVAIGGRAVADPGELGQIVRTYEPGDTVVLAVERDGDTVQLEATLGENTDPQSETAGSAFLGVSSGSAAEWQEMSLGDAAVSSVTELIPVTWESTKGVVKVLNPVSIWQHLTGENEDLTTRPTTVVGVTQVSASVGESEGLIGVLYLLAILNVFVGVFNMFPLLPLDGGHAAVATYERVREGRSRRRYFADIERLMPFAMGVIVVLLALFMSGLYLDISRPLR
jgi:membrane-associated protease RseP (regulator of RpoE activity)